ADPAIATAFSPCKNNLSLLPNSAAAEIIQMGSLAAPVTTFRARKMSPRASLVGQLSISILGLHTLALAQMGDSASDISHEYPLFIFLGIILSVLMVAFFGAGAKSRKRY